MQRNRGFLIFYDWMRALETLNPKDFKAVMMAMFNYQKDNIPPPEFSNKGKVIASFIFPQLERRKYLSEVGKKGAKALHLPDTVSKNDVSSANSSANGDATDQPYATPLAIDKVQDQEQVKEKVKE